jgi:hypothetical protein
MNAKIFKLPKELIKQLIPNMGGCLATDRITVDGAKVGFMYRENPDFLEDSGWRFFSGDETQEYVDDQNNIAIYEVNTICNYDESIIPYLKSEIGSAYGRVKGTDKFEMEPFPNEPE